MATLKKTITIDHDLVDASTALSIDLDLSKYKTIDFQINYTGADNGDGSIRLQRGNDNTRWVDVPGATAALNVTGGVASVDFSVADSAAERYRLFYTKGTDTAGSIEDVLIVAKTS